MARRPVGGRRGGAGVTMTFDLTGDEELIAAMRSLSDELRQQSWMRATSGAGDVLENALRSVAPARTGRLRASIRRNYSKKGNYVYVGLKKGAAGAEGRAPNFYATLINGRKPHRRMGRPRAGSPQMRGMWPFFDAANAVKDSVEGVLADRLSAEIDSAISRNDL